MYELKITDCNIFKLAPNRVTEDRARDNEYLSLMSVKNKLHEYEY